MGAFRRGYRGTLLRASLACLAAAGLVLATVSCGSRPAKQGGLDQYATDFSSADEIKNWKCLDTGQWKIKDGWLVGDARIPEQRSILWLDRDLAADVTISFDAECLDKAADINCFVYGNGRNYSGYEVILGGFENTKVGIYKSGEEGDPLQRRRLGREPFELQKDRVYSIKIKKDRGTFHLYVDGDLLMTETDDEPIDEDACYFGLSTWENVVRFDNFMIEKR